MYKASYKFTVINKLRWSIIILGLILFLGHTATAQQYNVAGTATAMSSPGCYMLTTTTGQSGAVWNIYTINLTQPFDITLSLNFGNRGGHYGSTDCGADGMSFVLQPLNSGVFGPGGGVGFQGIANSLGVVMDTYVENTTDPPYQHISMNKNGDPSHNVYSPAGVCPPTGTLVTTNPNEIVPYCNAIGWPCTPTGTYSCITDGLPHLFRFTWTPTVSGVGTANAYFGTATTLPTTPTLTYTGNIVANIFSGNPNVYWGVSGSTGGCWNNQSVCITTVANYVADTVACYGQPVLFFDNSLSGLPITSYLWDFADGTTSPLQNPTHTFTSPGLYLVSLHITNSGGFSSTMVHTVLIHPKPTVTVNDTTICKGDFATLNANGATSYFWSNGLMGSSINVSPQTTTTYIVTGQNEYYCTNKDTAIVSIYPSPVITTDHDSIVICLGDTATVTASGGSTYYWKPIGSIVNPLKVSPPFSTDYTVIGTSNLHGCHDSANVAVIISPDPQVAFLFDSNYKCEPMVVNFTNQTDPANATMLWNFGDGSSSTNQNPTHTYAAGTFTVTITATSPQGCKSISTNNNLINVYPQPHGDFSWNPPIGTLSDPIIQFTDKTVPVGSYTYAWDFGDGSTSGFIQNPSHLYTNVAFYNVMMVVTSDYGCLDTVRHSIQIVNDSLTFPNVITPNGDGINDKLVIKGLDGGAYPNSKMVIFNRWGKIVYESNNYQNDFDGNGLAAGVYYYIFTAKGVLREIKHQSSLEILR